MFITTKKHNAAIAELKTAFADTLAEYGESTRKTIAEAADASQAKLLEDAQKLFESALAADRKKRYESEEPYVEIISETFTEEGGIQLRFDWNQPFIRYLKANGITGPTDEAIVDNWVVALSRERLAENGSEFK